jgi:serine/threonine protein kinase
MLANPYNFSDTVAKPSRKSDIYAFAFLMWELLAEKLPFHDVKNKTVLSSIVHKHGRPPLAAMSTETPLKVSELIESCWQTDRAKRKSAVECFSVLQYHYGLLASREYDIFISHDAVCTTLACSLSYRLVQLGFRVCCAFSKQREEHDSIYKSKVSFFIEVAVITQCCYFDSIVLLAWNT